MKIAARKVGFLYWYTGTENLAQGWFDDFDGKWVYLSGGLRTIGNATSGATIAQAWGQTLFEHFWNQYDNPTCPLLDSSGGAVSRGASATADWNANRRITFPDMQSRALLVAGNGAGLSIRNKGKTVGAETHTLTETQMPSHNHRLFYSGGPGAIADSLYAQNIGLGATNSAAFNTTSVGTGASHNNMQPSWNEHLVISAGAR